MSIKVRHVSSNLMGCTCHGSHVGGKKNSEEFFWEVDSRYYAILKPHFAIVLTTNWDVSSRGCNPRIAVNTVTSDLDTQTRLMGHFPLY